MALTGRLVSRRLLITLMARFMAGNDNEVQIGTTTK